ncbi:putative trehalase [Scheffersomyces coipomensis]|uniref:putative trehalase n=1 Tax=Scheffersomyces coipomensis TaxID=1788519 RepID=UPI00315DC84B
MSDKAEREEYEALTATLTSFYNFYNYQTQQILTPKTIKYNSLTKQEQDLLPWFPKYLQDIESIINLNKLFTQALAVNIAQDWGVSSDPSQWSVATDKEFDKVKSTLLQISKEWSDEGKVEREIGFNKILDELKTLYPDEIERQNIKILNPGCGLGRLVMELVTLGFWTQGNEFSYHMLLASNFILNHCSYENEHSIFPFLHKSYNIVKRAFQLRPVYFPDLNPNLIHELMKSNPKIPYDELMSMTAGSFIDLYGPNDLKLSDTYTNDSIANEFRVNNQENFDVLITCFFIDTANNIIDYLKTIYYSLKKDGVWINFGPLLWHFEDDENMEFTDKKDANGKPIPTIMKGLELSKDDLIELIKNMGFKFEKHESNFKTTYCGDKKSLGTYIYDCEYWVCRKV